MANQTIGKLKLDKKLMGTSGIDKKAGLKKKLAGDKMPTAGANQPPQMTKGKP